MAKLTPPEEELLATCKEILDSIICRWRDEADMESVQEDDTQYRLKDWPMIDRAIREMWLALLSGRDEPFDGVEDRNLVRVEREAYHHAVNAFFRIFQGRGPGRPKTDPSTVHKMMEMRKNHKSYAQIARALDLEDPTGKGKDVVRKRLDEAAKSLKRKK